MALKYKVIRCVAYTIEIILLFILQELPYLCLLYTSRCV